MGQCISCCSLQQQKELKLLNQGNYASQQTTPELSTNFTGFQMKTIENTLSDVLSDLQQTKIQFESEKFQRDSDARLLEATRSKLQQTEVQLTKARKEIDKLEKQRSDLEIQLSNFQSVTKQLEAENQRIIRTNELFHQLQINLQATQIEMIKSRT